jgi:hypothetical protein
VYVFVMDVSYAAVASGMVAQVGHNTTQHIRLNKTREEQGEGVSRRRPCV